MTRLPTIRRRDLVPGRDLDENGIPTFHLVSRMLAYDPQTGHFSWKVTRKSSVDASCAGSANVRGYHRLVLFGRYYLAHRIAWLLSYGHWPERDIDHCNRDKADNRLANLRLVTAAENVWNTAHIGSSSGLRGVRFRPREKKWTARIQTGGVRYNLGYFDTADEAANAYAAAATAQRGSFAFVEGRQSFARVRKASAPTIATGMGVGR